MLNVKPKNVNARKSIKISELKISNSFPYRNQKDLLECHDLLRRLFRVHQYSRTFNFKSF